MTYVTIEDLLCQITSYDLADLLEIEESGLTSGYTDSILEYGEQVGLDTTFGYLNAIFTLSAQTSLTGSTRDYLVLNSVISIMLKTVYQRLAPNSVPQHITDSYTQAIETLRDLQNRKYTPKIQERDKDDAEKVRRIYTLSNPKITYPY
jgi:hypothetical protein